MRQKKKCPNTSNKLNSLGCFVIKKKNIFKVFLCNQEGLKIKSESWGFLVTGVWSLKKKRSKHHQTCKKRQSCSLTVKLPWDKDDSYVPCARKCLVVLPLGNERRACGARNTTARDPGPLSEYCRTPSLPSSGICTGCELNNFALELCFGSSECVCCYNQELSPDAIPHTSYSRQWEFLLSLVYTSTSRRANLG